SRAVGLSDRISHADAHLCHICDEPRYSAGLYRSALARSCGLFWTRGLRDGDSFLALACSLRARGTRGDRSIGRCGRAFQSARAEDLARLLPDDHARAVAIALELGRELDGVDRRRQWPAWSRTAKLALVPLAARIRRGIFLSHAFRVPRVHNRALGVRALARRLCAQGRARERGADASARIRRLAL